MTEILLPMLSKTHQKLGTKVPNVHSKQKNQ